MKIECPKCLEWFDFDYAEHLISCPHGEEKTITCPKCRFKKEATEVLIGKKGVGFIWE